VDDLLIGLLDTPLPILPSSLRRHRQPHLFLRGPYRILPFISMGSSQFRRVASSWISIEKWIGAYLVFDNRKLMCKCKHLSINNTPIAGQPSIRGICAIKSDPKNLARTVNIIQTYTAQTDKIAIPNIECPYFMNDPDSLTDCPDTLSSVMLMNVW